ncbi:acetyl-CoA synthase corrinoid iron-sulfur protein, large subunit [Candidatus Velamenicoccus archaeovorus]|uniref:Acetyl-CoA synthase corrinoid iron-sulfur protein, large subunit n=1 Tax=Velamenicoccus archaeovorus TaxID=1930593 RepID=A0A410P4N0_VELA1|nr:acetyl-CoA decarbonylase/synthase complex subunit gamma [Candidatus Velamenicoccus archaeovorus]QAT17126.1 acetyl-CoA synthase corrinoid iron-sulfur protein, large subunit [Candidatus Velamenicoccus archaeovorus]
MALSGLDIYKLLPKTNCKKCGFQTCLAFAMQLAKKAVSLDKCPSVGESVRLKLEEASLPAIRLVEIGTGERRVAVGQETVLFRHEEKFHHPTAIGLIVEDDLPVAELDRTLGQIRSLRFERVGQQIGVELVALRNTSARTEVFVEQLRRIRAAVSLPLVLMACSAETLKAALRLCASERPLVYCPKATDLEAFVTVCKESHVPLAFRASSLEEFSAATKKAAQAGFADLVLDIPENTTTERLWQLTQIRRLSLKKGERSLGFPTMVVVNTAVESEAVCQAAAYIAKYASILLVRTTKPEHILPLLTLRQNIYTDPQKPLQVEPNVYPVGAVSQDSPLLVTTNFSLTYYTVLGEIESSRRPCYLLCMDTEGMSVLTAWAAEKFGAEQIADTLTKFKLADTVRHKSIVIPGYVAMMSGDLEDKSGWRVVVGPREASGLPVFLKNLAQG